MGLPGIRWPLFSALLVLSVIGSLLILGGEGEATKYKADLSEYDFLCFEAEIDTLYQGVGFTFDTDLFVEIYGPDGREIEINHTLEYHVSQVDFVPLQKGKYTILMHSYYRTTSFTVDSNFHMEEISTKFTATITDSEWLNYEIEVHDNNKPIALYIKHGGTYNRLDPVMSDPSGNEVKPRIKGMDNRTYLVYQTRKTGTYELSIEGNRILMPEGEEFTARCNYPISGPGIPRTIMGMTLTTIAILVLLVLLVVISLVVVRRQLRKRRMRAPPWRAVTDISRFEQPSRAKLPAQRDYSYLSALSRRLRQNRAPPGPAPRNVDPTQYVPQAGIVPQAQGPPPPVVAYQGIDGYSLPPPPAVGYPTPVPPPQGSVHQVQQTYQPPSVQSSPMMQSSRRVQQMTPPQNAPPSLTPPPVRSPQPVRQTPPTHTPQVQRPPQMEWPKCSRCGNLLLANHSACIRCGAPR